MTEITLEQAVAVAAAAFDKAASMRLAPLTIAILDPGGHLVLLERQDGSGILRPEIAIGKAWGLLGMRLPARDLVARAAKQPQFYAALNGLAGGRMLPVPGGVLARDADGHLVAAVGISGDTSDNDEACVIAGLEAVGLVPWLE